MQTDQFVLTNGYFFLKHNKYSKPKMRHIFCSKDLSKIFWQSCKRLGQKNALKGHINIADIISINNGLTKSRKMSKEKKQERWDNCFTIVTNERTLELEAPSNAQKQEWLGIMKKLVGQVVQYDKDTDMMVVGKM